MEFFTSNGHILVALEGVYYVVDTGSPLSFSFCGTETVFINEKTIRISPNAPAMVSRTAIEELVGVPVVGFIGMDILRDTNLTIDFENGEILFGIPEDENQLGFGFVHLEEMIGGIVYTDGLLMNGKRMKAIIDTGAIYSYVTGRIACGMEKTGESFSDYNPEVGEIRSDIYKGRLSIDNSDIGNVKVGVMPFVYELLGMDAIIGVNILSEKCVFFDFAEMKLGIKIDTQG